MSAFTVTATLAPAQTNDIVALDLDPELREEFFGNKDTEASQRELLATRYLPLCTRAARWAVRKYRGNESDFFDAAQFKLAELINKMIKAQQEFPFGYIRRALQNEIRDRTRWERKENGQRRTSLRQGKSKPKKTEPCFQSSQFDRWLDRYKQQYGKPVDMHEVYLEMLSPDGFKRTISQGISEFVWSRIQYERANGNARYLPMWLFVPTGKSEPAENFSQSMDSPEQFTP